MDYPSTISKPPLMRRPPLFDPGRAARFKTASIWFFGTITY
jgi:hypothetical protein